MSTTWLELDPEDDVAWRPLRAFWRLRADTIYLNHGSFGPPPEPVRINQARWKQELDAQPMDFFVRAYEPSYLTARTALATWLTAQPEDLVFVENATAAMNIVAANFPLAPDDEVLLTDHEYGAVVRIWERACRQAGAQPPRTVTLPRPFREPAEVVDAIVREVTPRTKAVVVSHVTSPTAVILPVEAITARFKAANVAVIVDGPHAPAQVDLDLTALGCDFYCASCHKWLSAPFGSGFLFVDPRWQTRMTPPQLSWGRLLPAKPATWADEFIWSGTRDPSAYLAVPSAIEFLESIGRLAFRRRTHALARYARQRITALTGLEPLVPDDPAWYGTMAHCSLPMGAPDELQRALWQEYGIEVPIVHWGGSRFVRVSCHLYNHRDEIDRLVAGLDRLLARGL